MPNSLQSKGGAQPSHPVRYGVLWQSRFATGLWTQRSPLRDAASTRYEENYYGGKGDGLIDGLNTEISSKLTAIRRPGTTALSVRHFPGINRFAEYRLFSADAEQIRVLADSGGTPGNPGNIYDIGSSDSFFPTQGVSIFSKSPGAGSTYFLNVGNNLYFSDGVDTKKIVGSLLKWTASTAYATGDFIVDTFNNLQLSIGSQTATITNIQIVSNVCTVFFASDTSLTIPVNAQLTFAGLTTIVALNGTTQVATSIPNSQQFVFSFVHADTAGGLVVPETGTATTGTGISGLTEPAWAGALNQITVDGGLQWECRGPQIQNWGLAAPTVVPLVSQVAAPSTYPSWTASAWYAPLFVIYAFPNLFKLTTAGTTGGATPVWDTIIGNTTADGTAVWTCLGPSGWAASLVRVVGDILVADYTYYITTTIFDHTIKMYVTTTTPITVTSLFQCTVAGVSGTVVPAWGNGVGITTTDGTATWTNLGSPSAYPGPASVEILKLETQIIDTNHNIQSPQKFGKSGAGPVSWATDLGASTSDGTQLWLNRGPFGTANTGAWIYAYSFGNSVAGTVSTASPESNPIIVSLGNLAVVQGSGSDDPQCDVIYLWRTVQSGSIPFLLDKIQNPGAGQTWVYTDTVPDTQLNELISAPEDFSNDPPPMGISAMAYHLNRVWAAKNNSVYFSAGPDVSIGNGAEAFPPANVFVFPSQVNRLFPTSNGLIVFTNADIYIIQGLGLPSSPFFPAPYLENIGLASYDAFAVNGSIVYLYTTDNQILCLDPSSGVSEVGFPIGDQFGPAPNGASGGGPAGTFTPDKVMLTWHISQSQDKGLYISDRTGSWYRLCPTPSPETGMTWSPRAAINYGISAVQSIETSPGVHQLLIAPALGAPVIHRTIRYRDYTSYSDTGSSYPSWFILGSLVLAEPSQVAEVESLTTDCVLTGTAITMAVQLDEIAPLSAGYFEPLTIWTNDPPQLSPSRSVYAQRFYLSQTHEAALCRHMQIQVDFGSVDMVRNEILSLSLFGAYSAEK